MKKLLTSAALALALTAAGMTSYAVNWVYLGQDGNDRLYYDTSSVSRQGNLVDFTLQPPLTVREVQAETAHLSTTR